MNKVLFTFLTLGLLIIPSLGFAASTTTTQLPVVYLYHGAECPHCQAEIKFLDNLQKELPGLEVKKFEVWHDPANAKLMEEEANKLGIKVQGVPLTVIGDKYFIGFDNDQGIGQKIKNVITGQESENNPFIVKVPFIGSMDIRETSLVLLTAIIGTLDGFNPCSMWALLTMITIIMATGDKKKMWLVGWTFIIVSGASYFLFMSAWLNAFVFLSFMSIVRIAVGLVGIGSGGVSLYEFFTKKPEVCEVSSPEKQTKIVDRFKKVIESPSTMGLIIGVAGVAFSVNLVELMCSLGFPVVYTQALAIHNIGTIQKYLFIAAYVFFYMLLNIIVLLAAGFSSKYVIGNDKLTRYSRLIAGAAMVILGFIFIFRPELLSVR